MVEKKCIVCVKVVSAFTLKEWGSCIHSHEWRNCKNSDPKPLILNIFKSTAQHLVLKPYDEQHVVVPYSSFSLE